jgi:hypothetical protein
MSRLAYRLVAATALVAGFSLPATSSAQDTKSKGRAPRGVITLAEVTITGRLQKPIAAVDVQRIRAALTLSELEQPFLKRVEKVIYAEPF